jgi:hypothetical protein
LGFQSDLWHGEPPCSKSFCDVLVICICGGPKHPGLGVKFSEIDLTAACPSRVRPSYNDLMVVEQGFHVHIVASLIEKEWRHTPLHMEINCTLAQSGIGDSLREFADTQDDLWIGLQKLVNQVGQESGCGGHGTPDPDLPKRWVGQKFDVPDGLPQFIECGSRTIEQSLSVKSGLDTAWAAVEQSRVQCQFEIGNRFRNVWLRYAGPAKSDGGRFDCPNRVFVAYAIPDSRIRN